MGGIFGAYVLNPDQLNQIQQDLGWQFYYLDQSQLYSPDILDYSIYMAKDYSDLSPFQIEAMYDLLSKDCFPDEPVAKKWIGRTYWIEMGSRIISMACVIDARYYKMNFRWLIANVCVASDRRGERLSRKLLSISVRGFSQV